MSNVTSSVSVARTRSLLTIVTDVSPVIIPAVTGPALEAVTRSSFTSSASILTMRLLTFRMMSVTSSITPVRLENSCSAPTRRMWVTAAPSRLLSRIRRRLLPTVVPNPRSNGSAENFPYVSEDTCSSRTTRDGSSKPRQRIRM